ncbi:MAG: response regulator [Rhodobacterales bacterium]
MKILVVDDDEVILELLSVILEQEGHTNLAVSNSGEHALELIDKTLRPFDCILLDIQMPKMDGIELCAKIKTNSIYKDTPIIMISAMSTKDYINRAFAAGASDYITKPFDVLELGTRIKIAGTLVQKQRQLIKKERTIDVLNEELTKSDHYDILEPLNIECVDRVIDFLSFEKHISQLPNSALFKSKIFAIKIANIQKIHSRTTPAEFKGILTDIAEIISKNLLGNKNFISYRGNGVFVCFAHTSYNVILENMEIFINNEMVNLGTLNRNAAQLKVDLVFGKLKASGIFSKQNALGLLQDAINSVEKSVAMA